MTLPPPGDGLLFGVVAVLVVMVLVHIRTVGSISRIIREEKPEGWKAGLFGWFGDGNPRQPFWDPWMLYLIFGLKSLNVHDADYRKLLWRARASFVLSMVLFLFFILSVGWLTQGGR